MSPRPDPDRARGHGPDRDPGRDPASEPGRGRAAAGAPAQAIPAAAWVAAFAEFDALAEAGAEARQHRLDALQRDDPAQARALARLLQAHMVRAQGRGTPWLEALPPLPEPPDAARRGADEPANGGRLGPWRLLAELGRGGMSRVWLARRDDIPWSREVALKVPVQVPLFAGGDAHDPWQRELHERFVRERDLLSRLEHPHIARLYDAGFAGGVPWLALERVEGDDIVAWCERQALGVRERVALFRQVTQAVQYAHAALVVHRDLKPGNILVTAAGSVRLLDFGIARLMDPADLGAPAEATRTLLRPLTPAYASPEQLRQERLTTATDVYSLGVVLYELLSGAHPFLGRPRTASEIERAIVEGRIEPASRAAAGRGGAQAAARARALRGDLDAVLARAMHPQAEGRYASVADFDADLARWLAGEPLQARRAGWWRRVALTLRRHPVASAAGTAATAAVLASAGVALLQADRARDQAARAEATRDFVVGLFEGADPRLNGARDATARDLLEAAERRLSERATGDPALEAELLGALGQLWWQSGATPRALDAYARRTAVLARAGDPLAHALALTDEARAAALLEQWPRALAAIDAAEALVPRRSTPPALAARIAHARGWHALNAAKDPAAAIAALELAAGLARAAADARLELEARDRLAEALMERGDTDAAWRQLALIEALLAAHPELPVLDVLLARHARVAALWNAGRFAEGWPAVVELMDRTVRALGPGTALELEFRDLWLAWLLVLDRGPEAARWFAEDAARLPADVAADGTTRVDSRIAHAVRARARSGDDAGALAAARLGLDALRASPAAERRRVVRALAEAHVLAGRPRQALDTLAAWRREVQAAPAAPTALGAADVALALWAEAAAWSALGDEPSALQRWQGAAEQAARRWSPDHPYHAFIAVNRLAAQLRADAAALLADASEVQRLRAELQRAEAAFARTLPPGHRARIAVQQLQRAIEQAASGGALSLTGVEVVADPRRFLR